MIWYYFITRIAGGNATCNILYKNYKSCVAIFLCSFGMTQKVVRRLLTFVQTQRTALKVKTRNAGKYRLAYNRWVGNTKVLGSERRRRGGLGLLSVSVLRKEDGSNIYIWRVKRCFITIVLNRDATQTQLVAVILTRIAICKDEGSKKNIILLFYHHYKSGNATCNIQCTNKVKYQKKKSTLRVSLALRIYTWRIK